MRYVILITLLLIAATTHAQEVVAGGGGHHANTSMSIAYTIGEPVIATVSAGGNTLSQGFNQPWVDIGTVVDENTTSNTLIAVYPNPVRHVLYISMEPIATEAHYGLYDGSGRMLINGPISSTVTALDMMPYASGNYILRVSEPTNANQKSFKISINR